MSEPLDLEARFRCDHLFLLVSGNTLPNWVAAQLLLNPNGRVYLIYTSSVGKQLDRLKRVLEAEGRAVSCFETDSADERKIFKAVCDQAKKLAQTSSGRLGLHYTGGTKMMSVHAHHALLAVKKEFPATDPVFSYLDAEKLALKFDGGGEVAVGQLPQVSLNIRKLFDLHGDAQKYKQADPKRAQPDLFSYDDKCKAAEAAHGLALACGYPEGRRFWLSWYQKNRSAAQPRFPAEEDFNDLDDTPEVLTASRQVWGGFGVTAGAMLKEAVASRADEFKDVKALLNWFNGLWLEHYTMSQLAALRERGEIKLNDGGLVNNLCVTCENGRESQADVLALSGYQLYYFSCFTGNDFTTAKLKMFEAITRAEQLGGDEAKAAVVACIDDHGRLQSQVEAELQNTHSAGRFRVFGRESFPRLAADLKQWFKQP